MRLWQWQKGSDTESPLPPPLPPHPFPELFWVCPLGCRLFSIIMSREQNGKELKDHIDLQFKRFWSFSQKKTACPEGHRRDPGRRGAARRLREETFVGGAASRTELWGICWVKRMFKKFLLCILHRGSPWPPLWEMYVHICVLFKIFLSWSYMSSESNPEQLELSQPSYICLSLLLAPPLSDKDTEIR